MRIITNCSECNKEDSIDPKTGLCQSCNSKHEIPTKDINSDKIIIRTPSRMNIFDIEIPLTNWSFSEPEFRCNLNIASLDIEELNFVNKWIDEHLYHITHWGILYNKREYKFKLLERKLGMMTPPLITKEMTRGNIINSNDNFSASFELRMDWKEFLRFIKFIKNKTNEDIDFVFYKKN